MINENINEFDDLEEELEECAPPILPSFNEVNPQNELEKKINILKQEKKYKTELIENKEKEIKQLKDDIEEINKVISKYEFELVKEKEIIVETEEELKEREKEFLKNIYILFDDYKKIKLNENFKLIEYINNKNEELNKIFYFDKINPFYIFLNQIIKDKNNDLIEKYYDTIIKKSEVFEKMENFFYNQIKSFFVENSNEKEFVKLLLFHKKKILNLFKDINSYIYEIYNNKIINSNILDMDEYLKSSKENKILFLNNAIDNNKYEMELFFDKAKENLKKSNKDKAKFFLSIKKIYSGLNDKYIKELNLLKQI